MNQKGDVGRIPPDDSEQYTIGSFKWNGLIASLIVMEKRVGREEHLGASFLNLPLD